MKPAPVIRWPGAKWRIAEWICGHLPAHDCYVEPFFGSGAVFFNKEPARVEVINDLDQNVVNVFQVLREQPQELAALLALTPWATDEYHFALEQLKRPDLPSLERARITITITWQQFGKRRMQSRSGWRFRELAGQSPLTAWHNLPERVVALAERLQHAQISSMGALKLIRRTNGPEVLIYADPPYLKEVRGKDFLYDHEMTGREAHLDLIDALRAHAGPVVLSGYAHPFYDDHLPGWQTVSTSARTQTNAHRPETLWINRVGWRRLSHAAPLLIGGPL